MSRCFHYDLQLWALLRMMALWGVRSKPGRASNLTSENLCRIYLGFSLGLLQPLFLLLALLLCQTSLSQVSQLSAGVPPLCMDAFSFLHVAVATKQVG